MSVGQIVEFICVARNHGVRGVGVVEEPLLEAGHLRHGIDEGSIPLSFLGRVRNRPTAAATPDEMMVMVVTDTRGRGPVGEGRG